MSPTKIGFITQSGITKIEKFLKRVGIFSLVWPRCEQYILTFSSFNSLFSNIFFNLGKWHSSRRPMCCLKKVNLLMKPMTTLFALMRFHSFPCNCRFTSFNLSNISDRYAKSTCLSLNSTLRLSSVLFKNSTTVSYKSYNRLKQLFLDC